MKYNENDHTRIYIYMSKINNQLLKHYMKKVEARNADSQDKINI